MGWGLAVVAVAGEAAGMMLRSGSTESTTSHTPLPVASEIGVVMETGRSGRFVRSASSAREACG